MKADRQAPIGVFDSGVGGLTVVREIMRNLPDERIVYFGDTARVPYGSKSKNTVIRYSRQIVHFLETQQVKAIVIACNTASALALDTIEKEIDLPIISRDDAEQARRRHRNREHYSERPLPAAHYRGRSGDHRLRKTVSAVRAAGRERLFQRRQPGHKADHCGVSAGAEGRGR